MYNPNYTNFNNNSMYNNGIYNQIQPMQSQLQFLTRPVNGIDEARNYPIDPINTYILTDFNNDNIYIKKINNNGLQDFITFKRDNNNYNNFNNNYNNYNSNDISVINQRLTNIESLLVGGVKSNESNGANVFVPNAAAESTAIPKGTTNATGQKSNGN